MYSLRNSDFIYWICIELDALPSMYTVYKYFEKKKKIEFAVDM